MGIIRDKRKLDISYVPKKVPCREEEIEKVEMLLESGGRVVISGEIGTGKTLIAKFVAKDAIYVNCLIRRSERAVLREILSQAVQDYNEDGDLWEDLPDNISVILDEIDGIDDLRHFLYTLSRAGEIGKEIRYIAITRDLSMLKQLVNDSATWSTFAENCSIHLNKYNKGEILEILDFRAKEALRAGSYDDDVLDLISEIALSSEGHMRTGIEVLRNSAMLAEMKGEKEISPEDVRKVNFNAGIKNLDELGEYEAITLLSIALLCRKRACVSKEEVEKAYLVNCENYGIEAPPIDTSLAILERSGLIAMRGNKCLLLVPATTLISRLEKTIHDTIS